MAFTDATPLADARFEISDCLTMDASGLSFTKDGYLVGDAKIARAGNVQQYYGYELGLTGDKSNQLFGVYRDPDAVFDSAAMLSLAGRPVTRGHPADGVTASNWKDLSIGQVGGVIRKDGEHVVAPMAIMDGSAAQEVFGGARSLSAGYTATIVADEGVADGVPYQFRQAGPIRFNHVAYLPDNNPRAGNTRIGDQRAHDDRGQLALPLSERDTTMADPATLKTVVVDGFSISTTDQGAQAIDKLQKQLADALKAKTDADTAHTAAIAAKDTKIGTLTADLQKAKDALPTPAQQDQLVADRVTVITAAKAIDKDVKTDGVSNADIRKAVVTKKMGDALPKDASEAMITGMFITLTKDVKTSAAGNDPLRDVIKDGVVTADADKAAADAYAKMVSDMSAAHLPPKAA